MKPGANTEKAHLGGSQAGGVFGAVLPHPNPLPLGEGANSAAARQLEWFMFSECCRRFSLSQRERAGVREKSRSTQSAAKAPPTPVFIRHFPMLNTTLNFSAPGKQQGFLQVPWSHNLGGWANIFIPCTIVARGTGPHVPSPEPTIGD